MSYLRDPPQKLEASGRRRTSDFWGEGTPFELMGYEIGETVLPPSGVAAPGHGEAQRRVSIRSVGCMQAGVGSGEFFGFVSRPFRL